MKNVTQDKKALKRQERLNNIKKRLIEKEDIKYSGPLSYRYLKIIAWICFALGQFAVICTYGTKVLGYNILGSVGENIISVVGSISSPLFIIGSFGLILSGRRAFKEFIILYGCAYLGIAAGFCFFYARYINGLFAKLGAQTEFLELLKSFFSGKAEVNVFADLFAFVSFHFFINYSPKKRFQDKKVVVFRLFSLIPVLFVIGCYVTKVIVGINNINLPFYVYPFLTTKSPLVFSIFVIISFWIKYRERLFLKIGSTKDEYQAFLNTNKNSFSFSCHLSLLIGVFAIVDLIMCVVLFFVYGSITGYDTSAVDYFLKVFGCGECIPLIFAIPFIMLFSYTRGHENKNLDIIIPLVGIGVTALLYVEGVYQILIRLTSKS